jgi:Hemerythrin HHE cation binding domain
MKFVFRFNNNKRNSMERYNIFYQVHKGLRAMLYETALQIQQTDFINNEEAEQILEQVKRVIELFDKHAYSEDIFVFAAVEQYEPAVVDALEQEHVKDHALGENLNSLLTAFSNTFSDDDKTRLGKLLYQAFIEFMIFNLEHMAKKEDIINKLLWRNYSDEQLYGIAGNILASIPASLIGQFTKWTIRGLSNSEIVSWLKEVKNTAPEVAFKSLMQTAEQELIVHRLQIVQDAITEGAMLA